MKRRIRLSIILTFFSAFALIGIFSVACLNSISAKKNKIIIDRQNSPKPVANEAPAQTEVIQPQNPEKDEFLIILKDVGEPYLDNFGLGSNDFSLISQAGFNTIESNFDICADPKDVRSFLDLAFRHQLKVILPAGSGEAEWGYECDREYFQTQDPVWQEETIRQWINRWKSHPALYAWDISNEAGGNFPGAENSDIRLNLEQLQKAYRDINQADPNHPIMVRMNGWIFYENPPNDYFGNENPFGKEVADSVMVNAYSNVDEYFDDFVTNVSAKATRAILNLDPQAKVIISLGAWEEPPIWVKPGSENFENEYQELMEIDQLAGIAVFKYGAKGGDWYFPEDAPELWRLISDLNLKN